ncbi:hypothetical protein L1281_001196 [Neisseria sp. HSC-16F19]|nr:hypothetical protein [Neisseria sp. HSC-16F19]MCP2040613.1 hypothetical protein [Neisseria sp. HSC-16F19]
MSTYSIDEALTVFMPTLDVSAWLNNVGTLADHSKLDSPFNIQALADAKHLESSITSADFEIFDLKTRNALFAFARQKMNGFDTNPLARAVTHAFDAHKPYLLQKISTKQLPETVWSHVLLGIVISAFMEFFMQRAKPQLRMDVGGNLLAILNAGYLPCGWLPNTPYHESGYNPVGFVKDKSLPSFDYHSGVLLVY